MCGIAGLIDPLASLDDLRLHSEKLIRSLDHRGPDDSGLYVSSGGTVGLGHTRLSIIDPTKAGHQPMSTEDGRFWITFNGEIYNYRSLRAPLVHEGVRFRSSTDTEVILQLYARQGPRCVKLLRGMFAFAIWDDLEKTLFLARDPLGIKPLYYWKHGEQLIFASEIRPLIANGRFAFGLDPEGLHQYCQNGYVPDPHTIVNGISSLEPGTTMMWKHGVVKSDTYWILKAGKERSYVGEKEAREMLRQSLEDSIRHHFVSDVPVGVFLSGGIDSATVLALSSKVEREPLRTFSISFQEREYDEGPVAERVAYYFGAEHTDFQLNAREARNLFQQFLGVIDQPTADGFNTFCVSRLARENGVKVVLSGLGGDELFAGYPSFRDVPKMMRMGRMLRGFGNVHTVASQLLHSYSKKSKIRRVADYLTNPRSIRHAYGCYRSLFTSTEADKICLFYGVSHRPLLPEGFTDYDSEGADEAENISALEFTHYMRGQLLRDSDVMSMSNGVELRVPFVDRNLAEQVFAIPGSIRLKAGKRFLTSAVPELPTWLLNRPKRGFSFPFKKWLDEEWRDLFDPIRNKIGRAVPLAPWARCYSLFILENWLRNTTGSPALAKC